MDDISPHTPKKRYSCTSEYATPKGSDDSDNDSIYYSFVLSEDDSTINRENAVSEQTKINNPDITRLSKSNTPLLRKVLQTNYIPHIKNNKRVSLPKSSPQPTEKLPRLGFIAPEKNVFNLKMIAECITTDLPECSTVKLMNEKSEDSSIVNDTISDANDDYETNLHNTIIENPPVIENVNHNSVENESSSVYSVPQDPCNESAMAPSLGGTEDARPNEVLPDSTRSSKETKLSRQNLANDNRKSIFPTKKKTTRLTTYKYQPSVGHKLQKVDPRKSLGALKQFTKSVASANGMKVGLPSTNTTLAKHSKIAQNRKQEEVVLWPKLTTVNKPPRVTLEKTPKNRRVQRETITSIPIKHVPTEINGLKFVKPNNLPAQKPSTLVASTHVKGNNCQYCDKFFAKSHGMMTHLLEKCEKIPALARRLLHKEDHYQETHSKKSRCGFDQGIDSVSKYSRFFQDLTNDVQSGIPGSVDVENGLRNLRTELQKLKGAHTGIFRTPNKVIRCHICKKHFLDCVVYADHCTNCHKLADNK